MPWGCIGSATMGTDSTPGGGGCGLPGTFTQSTALKPVVLSASYDSKPRTPDTQ